MNAMKVSVLISNYNYARYLSAAIDSALAQTYSDIEIIVVDDGSTDDSQPVIEQYGDKIKSIFQENQGQGAAFNTGFKSASGEIIAFLDADDVWHPDKLQRVTQAFENPEVIGVMHLLENIDASGEVMNGSGVSRSIPGGNLAKVVLATGNAWWFPPTSGLAYRRSALEKVLPMDTSKWRLCADGCLVYCTAFLGDIITLNEVLGSYRLHGSNNFFHKDQPTREQQVRALAGVEMTNQYLNEFLNTISYPEQVDLSRNLQYRRSRYYFREQWDIKEAWSISGLILTWLFYSYPERIYYLARFLLKSIQFSMSSANLVKQKHPS